MLSVWSWMWRHPVEGDWAARKCAIEGNWLSLPQKPSAVYSLSLRRGSPCVPSCSLLGFWLGWSCAFLVWNHTYCVRGVCFCTAVSKRHCSAPVFPSLRLTQSYHPSSRIAPKLGQGVWSGCPTGGWALYSLLFSALWPVLDSYVNCHPLHK